MSYPILYSFRRCPYAMRARLAIASAGIACELREIVLRDKAPAFLTASPKGTVPVVVTDDGQVIEESFDIMHWALSQNDPEGLLRGSNAQTDALIAQFDGPFKAALDAYKYAPKDAIVTAQEHRAVASAILAGIDHQLTTSPCLFGDAPTLADFATLPFVRQFAFVDKAWFDAQQWPGVARWLHAFLDSDRFAAIMGKYPKWQAGDDITIFPSPA